MKNAKSKAKRELKNRTRLEWILLILLLLIAYLLLASRYEWWPWNTQKDNLGTAFYVVKQNSAEDASGLSTNGNSASSSGSGNSANGSGGSNNNGGGSNNNGTNNPPSSSKSPLLTFAAGIDTGNSKQETSGQANGLNENCVVVVNSSAIGKQEVCTYTEGDKIITVTYLNDNVVSASRFGF